MMLNTFQVYFLFLDPKLHHKQVQPRRFISHLPIKLDVLDGIKIPPLRVFTEMLQFVSNQVGEFPDLFSEPLCGSFPGGGSGNGNGSGSGGGGGGSGAGSGDPSGQRPFSQVPLPAFSPSATSSQAATLPVKAPAASGPTPPRAAPVLQPRPQPQPPPPAPLPPQTVMITSTFSTAPQTRIIQQPVIYQNAATSFQGDLRTHAIAFSGFKSFQASLQILRREIEKSSVFPGDDGILVT